LGFGKLGVEAEALMNASALRALEFDRIVSEVTGLAVT
jgi:hypothetical protein